MDTRATQETLRFNNFSGYYGSISQGYGGFKWGDIDFMNATFWEDQKTNWCDTGFQNVIKGAGEAFTWDTNGFTSYAVFENTKETFSLKSMVAASGWETDQTFDFNSYTYTRGKGFHLQASDQVIVSQTAELINFSKIGKPGDFKNLAAVEIVSGSGKYGNTCTYGRYGYTLGNNLAFDDLNVQWNGKIPKSDGKFITTGLANHAHGRAVHIADAHLVSGNAHSATGVALHADSATPPSVQTGFHSELLSLGTAHGGALTSEFQLPAIEHFGT
jgi:hypothetical protein